jgi:hypothetical protein
MGMLSYSRLVYLVFLWQLPSFINLEKDEMAKGKRKSEAVVEEIASSPGVSTSDKEVGVKVARVGTDASRAGNTLFDFATAVVDQNALDAAVERTMGEGEYVLRVSVSPLVMGEGQHSAVVVFRFQKAFGSADYWCIKPNYLISSIQAAQVMFPRVGWSEVFGSMQEYVLREVPHGANVPKTNMSKGRKYEARILAGFLPLGRNMNVKDAVVDIGNQLSNFMRSDLFRRVYLRVTHDATFNAGITVPDTGSEVGGIYGKIKDEDYPLWRQLKEHRLDICFEQPLDAFFLDDTIAVMLTRMFPDKVDMGESLHVVGWKHGIPNYLKGSDVVGSSDKGDIGKSDFDV